MSESEVALFEGPEKKLEIDWFPSSENPKGLLNITEAEWSTMLDLAGCKILSALCTEKLHSYVLSESSLFVYPASIILKTCGTTTLLNTIPLLIEYASRNKLVLKFASYCRKNFMFPSKQLFPHSSFDVEIDILKRHFRVGDAYILGPVSNEHWYFWEADLSPNLIGLQQCQTLDIMMTELDPAVMEMFFQTAGHESAKACTKALGLDTFLSDAQTDEFLFDPCGFSLNALNDQGFYYTIHVTPEASHSYVSFETNINTINSFDSIIKQVIDVFKPGKFSIALFTDHDALAVDNHQRSYLNDSFKGYVRSHKTTQEFDGNYCATLSNYVKPMLKTPSCANLNELILQSHNCSQ